MASIRKREVNGEKRWDATVTRRGAPRQSQTFQTKGAAERWSRETERSIEMGTWRSTDSAESTKVSDLLNRYSRDVLASKKSAKSLMWCASYLANSSLGPLPLIALIPERVAQYRDQRLRSTVCHRSPNTPIPTRLLSTQTVRHEIALLRRAIDHAMKEWSFHLPAGNPVSTVRLPPPAKARDRRLDGDEYKRLIEAVYASESIDLARVFEIAIETAMRRGEISNLDWSDIDLNRRVAQVRDSKNGDPRAVPLSNRAIEIFQSMPRPIMGGRVFQLSKFGVSQAFRRVCLRVGLKNLRFHDLRHEATSRLAEKLNGNVLALAAITGHKSLQMLKRYTHLRAEELALRIA